jgi:hypothetical protein
MVIIMSLFLWWHKKPTHEKGQCAPTPQWRIIRRQTIKVYCSDFFLFVGIIQNRRKKAMCAYFSNKDNFGEQDHKGQRLIATSLLTCSIPSLSSRYWWTGQGVLLSLQRCFNEMPQWDVSQLLAWGGQSWQCAAAPQGVRQWGHFQQNYQSRLLPL